MPAQFKDITNPNRKGTWLRYVEPTKVEAA
jgi:hypothetical protein